MFLETEYDVDVCTWCLVQLLFNNYINTYLEYLEYLEYLPRILGNYIQSSRWLF